MLKRNPQIAFGSHTMNHARLSQLQNKEIRQELRSSKDLISSIIGYQINELALPYGDYKENVIQIALEEGYQKIYTLEPAIYNSKIKFKSHIVGRFLMSPDVWLIEFYFTIKGAYGWLNYWRSLIKNKSKYKRNKNAVSTNGI